MSTKLGLALIVLACSMAFGCQERQKSPEQLRMELMMNERSNWSDYIQLKDLQMLEDNHLFKADEVVVTGSIVSSASIAEFKDIQYKVIFYSKTNTIIEEKGFIVYEFLKPNSILPLSVRMIPPKGYAKFNVELTGVAPS